MERVAIYGGPEETRTPAYWFEAVGLREISIMTAHYSSLRH
jgi:hypothetical protein